MKEDQFHPFFAETLGWGSVEGILAEKVPGHMEPGKYFRTKVSLTFPTLLMTSLASFYVHLSPGAHFSCRWREEL